METISGRQLFIDDTFVKESENISLITHKPVKTYDRCITVKKSSHRRIGGYSSVNYHSGQYHIWYVENNYEIDGIYVCVKYAISNDGINWEMPELGLAAHYKRKPNNVVLGYGAGGVEGGLGDGTCMVFYDPNDNMFKMTARHGLKKPLGLYVSRNGIHWKKELEVVLDDGRYSGEKGVFHLDSQNVIFWDDRIKKYVSYVRKNFEKYGQYRTIARGEADSLQSFPIVGDMPVVLETDEFDYQIDTPAGRLPASDFYTNATIKYPWANNAYFMFPNIYFKYDTFLNEFADGKPRNAGPIDIRLASSKDGISWNRHDRKPFVGIGRKEDFDSYSLYMLNGIVPGANDKMYMYYMGTDLIHGWDRGDQYEERENRILKASGFEPENRVSVISRLELRKDGFVSVSSDYKGGRFSTPVIKTNGGELILNADTGACGMIRVGLMDESNKWIEGYSIDDSIIIHTCNSINRKVRWEDKDNLKELTGKNIKMAYEMVDSDLYAFELR